MKYAHYSENFELKYKIEKISKKVEEKLKKIND